MENINKIKENLNKLKDYFDNKYKNFSLTFEEFKKKTYSNYKNHSYNTKVKKFFLTNICISSSLYFIYKRNHCFFKFSESFNKRYWISFYCISFFFLFSSMILIFSKSDLKEFLERSKFLLIDRLLFRENNFIKDEKKI
jgi:hypothetical protein